MRLNKLKKTWGIQSTFPSKNKIDIEIKSRRTSEKFMHIWEVSNTLISNPCFRETGKKKTRKKIELNENENRARKDCSVRLSEKTDSHTPMTSAST